jgi:hypothetical protein
MYHPHNIHLLQLLHWCAMSIRNQAKVILLPAHLITSRMAPGVQIMLLLALLSPSPTHRWRGPDAGVV